MLKVLYQTLQAYTYAIEQGYALEAFGKPTNPVIFRRYEGQA